MISDYAQATPPAFEVHLTARGPDSDAASRRRRHRPKAAIGAASAMWARMSGTAPGRPLLDPLRTITIEDRAAETGQGPTSGSAWSDSSDRRAT